MTRNQRTLVLAILLAPGSVMGLGPGLGCSSRVQGSGEGRGGAPPALLYDQNGLPGIRHAAHPDAPEEGAQDPGKAVSAAPLLVCAQGDLEAESAKSLASWLGHATTTAQGAPLPPDRPPHLDPLELTRFALALPQRHPDARKGAGSFRAVASLRLRYAPDHDAEEVGLLQKGMRLPVTGFVGRQGCRAGWLALAPYTYVCASQVKPDGRPPSLTSLPRVPEGRITPGDYGYIRPGGAPAHASRADVEKRVTSRRLPGGFFIRFGRLVRIKDQNYWKTTKGLYVPIDRIARHVPSRFHGFRVGGAEGAVGKKAWAPAARSGFLAARSGSHAARSGSLAARSGSYAARSGSLATDLGEPLRLPLAIVRQEGPGKRGIPVFHTPGKSKEVGRLRRYTAVNLLGTLVRPSRRGQRTRYLRIGPCQWIEARATRVAHHEAPPPGVTASERWIDVDLERQVLVAYEGREPRFVTLVATGKKGHDTRHGIFRVYWKVAEVDMANEAGADEEYLAEAVPWAMFFWKGQALHGAYWHDDFGRQRSHGCVNLSPLDARFLFEWAAPTLPSGWRHSWHGERFPGTLVQVRRRRGEPLRFLGLARKLAPKDAVAARDEAFARRVQHETNEMLGGSPSEEDDDEGDAPGATPGPTPGAIPGAASGASPGAASGASPGAASGASPGAATGATPGPAASPSAPQSAARRPASGRPAVHRPAARGPAARGPAARGPAARGPAQGGLRPALRPINAPPPPPRGR